MGCWGQQGNHQQSLYLKNQIHRHSDDWQRLVSHNPHYDPFSTSFPIIYIVLLISFSHGTRRKPMEHLYITNSRVITNICSIFRKVAESCSYMSQVTVTI